MANETTLNLKLKVNDDGSVVLDKFGKSVKQVETDVNKMSGALNLIKWDSIVSLGERAFHVGEQIYSMGKQAASALNDIERSAKVAGMTSAAYQKLGYAAKMSDVDISSLSVGMKTISRIMDDAAKGTGDAAAEFAAIGVPVKNSEGNLRSLNDILGDVADKFATWEDGPRKIAIALSLFGRSGEALIPMLNRGRAGMADLYAEAERLGLVFGDKLVKKGSEVEDQFKRMDAQIQILKTSFALDIAAPLITHLTKLLEIIRKIESTSVWQKAKDFAKETIMGGPAAGMWSLLPGKAGMSETDAEIMRKSGWGSGVGELAKGAPAGGANRYLDLLTRDRDRREKEIAEWYEYLAKQDTEFLADYEKNRQAMDDSWDKFYSDLEKASSEYWAYEAKAEMEAVDTAAKNSSAMTDAYLKYYEDLDQLQHEYDAGEARLSDERLKRTEKEIKESDTLWTRFGESLSSSLSAGFFDLFKGGISSISDVWRQFCDNLWQSFARAVSQMIVQWLLFEQVQGGAQGGGQGLLGGGSGLGQMFGLLGRGAGLLSGFGSIGGVHVTGLAGSPVTLGEYDAALSLAGLAFAKGGVVSRPTLGLIGEAGPEAVIPLKNGKLPTEGGGGTNIYFVNPIGFPQALMENMGTIIGGIHKSSRARGSANSVIRNG